MSVQNNPNAVGASESHAPTAGPATEGQIKVGAPAFYTSFCTGVSLGVACRL